MYSASSLSAHCLKVFVVQILALLKHVKIALGVHPMLHAEAHLSKLLLLGPAGALETWDAEQEPGILSSSFLMPCLTVRACIRHVWHARDSAALRVCRRCSDDVAQWLHDQHRLGMLKTVGIPPSKS
jgi:hypothetical protein